MEKQNLLNIFTVWGFGTACEDKLEISAETKHEEEKKEKGYIYKERRSGSYYRTIPLPSSIDSDNSKASYNNGILQITMPKTEIKKKTPLKVE
jgi:HSP20 family protein